jgi:hypothetical protein
VCPGRALLPPTHPQLAALLLLLQLPPSLLLLLRPDHSLLYLDVAAAAAAAPHCPVPLLGCLLQVALLLGVARGHPPASHATPQNLEM